MMKALWRFSDFLDEFGDWWFLVWPQLFMYLAIAAFLGLVIYGIVVG